MSFNSLYKRLRKIENHQQRHAGAGDFDFVAIRRFMPPETQHFWHAFSDALSLRFSFSGPQPASEEEARERLQLALDAALADRMQLSEFPRVA